MKAEKKMGVTHRVEVDWAVNPALLASNAGSIPAAPTISDLLPEGIQPRADDVIYLGGANCTSTDTRTKKSPTPTEPSCETSLLSGTTMPEQTVMVTPLANGTPKLSATAAETPQPVLISLTEVLVLPPEASRVVAEAITNPPEPNEALKKAAQRYDAPFKLPMEG